MGDKEEEVDEEEEEVAWMQGSKFVLAAAGEKEMSITVSSVAVLCDCPTLWATAWNKAKTDDDQEKKRSSAALAKIHADSGRERWMPIYIMAASNQ